MNADFDYRYPHWRCVEDTFLLSMNKYMSLKELSKQMNISIVNVQDRLRELNVNKNPPKKPVTFRMCDNPSCFTVIVNSKRGCCSKECATILKAVSFPPKSVLEKLYESGKDVGVIAEDLGLSYVTVLHLLYRYGISRGGFNAPTKGKSTGRVSFGGIKEDLGGVYVRSRWEANVLRYLNLKKITWEFEPKTFEFKEIKRGTTMYTPDILIHPNSPKKSKWIEVKGYLRSADKTKIKRFKKYYPDEFSRLEAITQNPNVAATRFFKELGVPIFAFYDDIKNNFSHKIKNWEG